MKTLSKILVILRELRVVILGRYHNRLTTMLVLLGSELMLDQVWLDIIVHYYNEHYGRPNSLVMPDIPHYPYLGLTIIILALVYNLYLKTRIFDTSNELLVDDISRFKEELSQSNLLEASKELKYLARRLNDEKMIEKSTQLIALINKINRQPSFSNNLIKIQTKLERIAYFNFLSFKIPSRPNPRKINVVLENLINSTKL